MKKFLLFVVLLGAGAGAWYWYTEQQKLAHREPKKPVFARLSVGDVVEKVSATGKVIPHEKILVSTDVPLGIVTEINPEAEPSKFVRKGTWLIRLDDGFAQAGLKEAEAALDAAKATRGTAVANKKTATVGVSFAQLKSTAAQSEFDRQMAIAGQNISPGQKKSFQDKLDEAAEGVNYAQTQVAAADAAISAADANIARAQAGVEVAKIKVGMMTIHAPRDGVILERKVLVGQPVSPQNSPLFIMMPSGNDWEVFAMVSEGDIAKVHEGQGVEFTADAYNSKNVKFKGTVLKKDRVPTQLTGSSPIGLGITGPTNYGVTITVQHDAKLDKEFPLLAGMTANVDILVSTALKVTRVPVAALQYRPGTLTKEQQDEIDAKGPDWTPIWVWNSNRSEMRFIKVGVNDGSFAEVVSVLGGGTLQPGTEVVIEDPPPEEEKGSLFGGTKVNIPIR